MTDTAQSIALLGGYRVLDLSSSMGAFCGKLLRDLGMDVVKVEPPTGDATRAEPPFAKGHVDREGSLRFAYLNAGKRSITLNIAKPSGRNMLLANVEYRARPIELWSNWLGLVLFYDVGSAFDTTTRAAIRSPRPPSPRPGRRVSKVASASARRRFRAR